MSDRVKKASYAYVMVPNRAGQGLKVLDALRKANVDLAAFSAFPARGGKTQVDLIADDIPALKRVARQNDWRLSQVKKGFLIQGADRLGAVHRQLAKLAAAKISVTAADAVSAGMGRYGMILWVRQKDHARAARALGAR
jgi:hypothetical protein